MNEEIDNTNEEEIQQTVRKLKTGKSPGPDGISAEHLKHMPSELIPYLINIINLIFMGKDVPQGVKEGVLTSRMVKTDYTTRTIVELPSLILFLQLSRALLKTE